ncbi:MAG: Subtilisin BL [Opitutia bacterium UBA7350]|nr:MAG: Subtilisin BL [Opitutae bacterium UBA7350]
MRILGNFFLLLLALLLGWQFAHWYIESKPEVERVTKDPQSGAVESKLDRNATLHAEPSLQFPHDADADNVLLAFPDEASYYAYLEALINEDGVAVTRLDALRGLRIDSTALRLLDPRNYGGAVDFNYRVQNPKPPLEANPIFFESLTAFGASAREIAGGGLEGRGSGVVIAVVDSGIADHAAFDAVEIESNDWVKEDVSEIEARAHGTAVASILGGKMGLAPEARLLDFRVLDKDGEGSVFAVAEAIVRATDMGAHIINLSLGLYQETALMREAVRYADANGVLMVAAAGNDAQARLPYPAAYSEVLSVTAVDGLGLHAGFSNRSERINFAAPGVGVYAADPKGNYRSINGTSAATPFVSGTLAALLSEEPHISGAEAIRLLQSHLNEAGASGADPEYGGGILDWDRLRNRAIRDYEDLALASIHLDRATLPGTRAAFKVVVQNRGTVWIPKAELIVAEPGAAKEQFTITSLAPGASSERTVYRQLPPREVEATLVIGAQVRLEEGALDRRPENNNRMAQFQALGVK